MLLKKENILTWAAKILDSLNQELISHQLVSNWGTGEVYLLKCTQNLYIAKKCQQQFRQEPKNSITLSEFFASNTPSVISINEQHRFILTLYSDGRLLSDYVNDINLIDAIEAWSKLQLKASKYKNQLLNYGIPNKVDFSKSSLGDLPYTIYNIEFIKLALKSIYWEVKYILSLEIPYSIVHGDLNSKNIICKEDVFIFIDWSEAFIGNPILDLLYYLIINHNLFNNDDKLIKTISARYLKCWGMHSNEYLQKACVKIYLIIKELLILGKENQLETGNISFLIKRELPLLLTLSTLRNRI